MSKIKKMFVLALMLAIISFVAVGCKDKGEQPAQTAPAEANEKGGEKPSSGEHPAGEHPK